MLENCQAVCEAEVPVLYVLVSFLLSIDAIVFGVLYKKNGQIQWDFLM